MRTPRRIFINGRPAGAPKPVEQKKKEAEPVAVADGEAAAAPDNSAGVEGIDAAAAAPNADADSAKAHGAKEVIPAINTTAPRKSPAATIIRKIRVSRKK